MGDWICIGEVEGQVKSVDWRAVSLQTEDEYLVMIPNAVIAKQEFKNFSKPTPRHRMNVKIKFSIEHPPNQVIRTLLVVVSNIPEILKNPKPDILLLGYNSEELLACYEIYYFISNYENKDDAYKLLMSQIWYVSRRENFRVHPEQPIYPVITTEQLFEKLKMLHVFDVRDDDLRQLVQNAKLEDYGVQEFILTKNITSTQFFIIMNGIAEQRYEITVDKNQQTATYRLTTGDFFGFSGMVSNENRGENVVAITDLTVITITIEAIRKMLQRNPQLADCLENVVRARSASS